MSRLPKSTGADQHQSNQTLAVTSMIMQTAHLRNAVQHAIMAMPTASGLPAMSASGPRRQALSDRLRTWCSVHLQRAVNITQSVHTLQKYASLIAAAFAAGSLCLVRRLSPGRCSLALETAVCCTCLPPELHWPTG